MIKILMTAQEVIQFAFAQAEQITIASIKETKIDAAQEKYLRPTLGALFDALLDGKYPELLGEFIKPALAYYVRYAVIPDISAKLNDGGAQVFNTTHSNAATDKQRIEMRQQAKHDANALLDKAVRYIEAHKEEFTEYEGPKNVRKRILSNGGLILI